ncbi:hypothetical protein SLA2020_092610 [Shorea laevis]
MADPALHQTQPIKQIAITAPSPIPSLSHTTTAAEPGGAPPLASYKSQDEIDFEFLGKDKTIIQTNYYTTGTGSREQIHDMGFDCSDGFHEYVIKWGPDLIEWLIDGKVVRRAERKESEAFPEKPMFSYASVWDASCIDEGRWAGNYVGCDAPYVSLYKDIHVPSVTAVECSSDS